MSENDQINACRLEIYSYKQKIEPHIKLIQPLTYTISVSEK